MGIEYRVKFADLAWYRQNVARVAEHARLLPHLVAELPFHEFRFKGDGTDHSWTHDLRLFLGPDGIQVEVSVTSETFHTDLLSLVSWLREETDVTILDDDDCEIALLSRTP